MPTNRRPELEPLTVQQLIDELHNVQDKTKIVKLSGCDCYTTAAYVEEVDNFMDDADGNMTGAVIIENTESPPKGAPKIDPYAYRPPPAPDKQAPDAPPWLRTQLLTANIRRWEEATQRDWKGKRE